MVCLISLLLLCSCAPTADGEQEALQHQHVPDGADCQQVQYCADCGEKLADQGPHAYPMQPDVEQDGYSYYICRVCRHIKIINQDGLPVVPVG